MSRLTRRFTRILVGGLLLTAATFHPTFTRPAAAVDCSAFYCAWLEIVPGNGAGTGFVSTNPYGIECEWSGSRSGTCLFQFSWSHADTDGIDVDLYLDPGAHSYVCYGQTCAGLEQRLIRTVHLNPGNDIDVFPVFNAASHLQVNIRMNGSGNGTVKNASAGLDCVGTAGQESGDCQGDWYFLPDPGFRASWVSDPADETYVCHAFTSCSVPNQTVNYSAGFGGGGTTSFDVSFWDAVPLTVNLTGLGTVVSSPAGISCPPTCSKWFPPRGGAPEDDVVLTATPASGWFLKDWGGVCDGKTGPTCTFQVSYTGPTVSVVFASLATPVPTTKPTTKPTPTPTPRVTARPSAAPTSAPPVAASTPAGASPALTTAPLASADPGASPDLVAGASPSVAGPSSSPAGASSGPAGASPAATEGPDAAAGGSGGGFDLTVLLLIALAILVLVVLLVIGFVLGRRRTAPRSA